MWEGRATSCDCGEWAGGAPFYLASASIRRAERTDSGRIEFAISLTERTAPTLKSGCSAITGGKPEERLSLDRRAARCIAPPRVQLIAGIFDGFYRTRV